MTKHETGTTRIAFTLVELMVVVVIIGIMATVVTLQVSDYLVTAKQNVAKSELATMRSAIELFFMENDRYPTTDEGLAILTKQTARHPNGMLSSDLKDPWNREYVYVYPGVNGPYELVCFGADGQEGGSGADQDISTANLQNDGTKP
jgi:general secretion pathway protein G